MKLIEILRGLHSSNDSRIVEILNTSIKLYHPTEWLNETRDVIHSGFRFHLHSGDSVDLLIDLAPVNPALLWQVRLDSAPLPLLLGMQLTQNEGDYTAISSYIMVACSGCTREKAVVGKLDFQNLNLNHNEFKVFLRARPDIFTAFPLSKEYSKRLFYGQQGFTTKAEFHKEFVSKEDEHYYQENQYYTLRNKEEDQYNSDDLLC